MLDNVSFKQFIQYWYSYVDDIVYLWTGNIENLNNFLTLTNTINGNKQFTIETGNKMLNFFDIEMKLLDHRQQFKIFQKPFKNNIMAADSNRL